MYLSKLYSGSIHHWLFQILTLRFLFLLQMHIGFKYRLSVSLIIGISPDKTLRWLSLYCARARLCCPQWCPSKVCVLSTQETSEKQASFQVDHGLTPITRCHACTCWFHYCCRFPVQTLSAWILMCQSRP